MSGFDPEMLPGIALVVLLAVGCFFVLVGSFGLFKLSDFFKRLHGPTKATTLGVGCILVASILWHGVLGDDGLGLRELLVTVFLFLTAPVSAHLMARAALALEPGVRPDPPASPEDGRKGKAPRDGAGED
ncbi:Na+/H+ antiporter subunit G [Luteimonas pelagia]